MPGLDDISEAIGGLRADVRHGNETLERIQDTLQAFSDRVGKIERDNAYAKGKAAGYGALAGAGVTAGWKLIASKLGFGG